MTIEIDRAEVEALIRQRLERCGFKDPHDMIFQDLRAAEEQVRTGTDLIAAFPSSPHRDVSIEAPSEWKLLVR